MPEIRQVLKGGPVKLFTRYVAKKVKVDNNGVKFRVWRGEAFDHRRIDDVAEAAVALQEVEDAIAEFEDPDKVPAHLFEARQTARNDVSGACISGRILAGEDGTFDSVFVPVSGEEVKVSIGEVTGQYGPYYRALRVSELDPDPEATVAYDWAELRNRVKGGEALHTRPDEEEDGPDESEEDQNAVPTDEAASQESK